ncbi:MAG: hypothetical protein V2I43_15195 [Parvularcula sp.]|jgi:hypothetical protein|nr:hypothetical protein [Parvularcula sp.]
MKNAGLSFWLVGILALVINGFGLFDMLMTVSQNEDYLASYTPEQVAYFNDLPGWRIAIWVLGVCAALLATLLFLAKRKLSVPLFAVAPVMMIIGFVHDAAEDGLALYGVGGTLFALAILGIQIFFFWYARRLAKNGLLN